MKWHVEKGGLLIIWTLFHSEGKIKQFTYQVLKFFASSSYLYELVKFIEHSYAVIAASKRIKSELFYDIYVI